MVQRTDIALLMENEGISKQIEENRDELATHFEGIQFWIWKRTDDLWWKSRRNAFQGTSVAGVKTSLDLILRKRPDSLVLIRRAGRPDSDVDMKLLHRVMKQMDNLPITLADARQGDVELLRVERTELLP